MHTAVIQQNEEGEHFIVLPDEIVQALDLKVGDTLEWEIHESYITVRKAE